MEKHKEIFIKTTQLKLPFSAEKKNKRTMNVVPTNRRKEKPWHRTNSLNKLEFKSQQIIMPHNKITQVTYAVSYECSGSKLMYD